MLLVDCAVSRQEYGAIDTVAIDVPVRLYYENRAPCTGTTVFNPQGKDDEVF